jgi:hypothetical protein
MLAYAAAVLQQLATAAEPPAPAIAVLVPALLAAVHGNGKPGAPGCACCATLEAELVATKQKCAEVTVNEQRLRAVDHDLAAMALEVDQLERMLVGPAPPGALALLPPGEPPCCGGDFEEEEDTAAPEIDVVDVSVDWVEIVAAAQPSRQAMQAVDKESEAALAAEMEALEAADLKQDLNQDGVEGDGGSFMAVVCPDGVGAGDLIVLATPDGREVEAEVPEGIEPGAEFEVYVGSTDDGARNDGSSVLEPV